jgi:trehalose 6-phosphate synthase
MEQDKRRLVVVSNRLPVVVKEDGNGGYHVTPGSGGLITALNPVISERGGRWVGWFGLPELRDRPPGIDLAEKELGYQLDGVVLDDEEVNGYYHGFSNEVLWPLCHDFISLCNFDPAYWPVYQKINRKFAEKVVEVTEADDYVWIQDYHLMLVARELRALGVQRELGYFLHIPFPPLDVFLKMPWRRQILEGLLQYDLLGFQTDRDVRNFVQCVRFLSDGATIEEAQGRMRIAVDGRTLFAQSFPISIDYNDFLNRSVSDEVSERCARLRSALPKRRLILGLDRLDYSKGIPHRINAFGNALDRYPELHGKVTFIQVVIPSRSRVEGYAHLKDEIDRLVGKVNGRHTRAGWTPIQYIFRSLDDTELLAYYRTCDIALITPLKDGMNLVCKEYCACSLEGNGVLILSEFAGAAIELADEGALIVNPFDIEECADAIHRAVNMSDEERSERMQKLRKQVHDNDVFAWVERYLAAAAAIRQRPANDVAAGA